MLSVVSRLVQDFCGDLAKWTALILETTDAPLVHSVSYGWQGDLRQIQCSAAKYKVVDANFAKLAAMGITITRQHPRPRYKLAIGFTQACSS